MMVCVCIGEGSYIDRCMYRNVHNCIWNEERGGEKSSIIALFPPSALNPSQEIFRRFYQTKYLSPVLYISIYIYICKDLYIGYVFGGGSLGLSKWRGAETRKRKGGLATWHPPLLLTAWLLWRLPLLSRSNNWDATTHLHLHLHYLHSSLSLSLYTRDN